MLSKHSILPIFFLLASNLLAQQRVVKFETTKPLNQSSIDQWTTDQGLSSNNLVNIMQASSGYLWIATYDGLLRFDGNQFEIFDRENIPFLNSNAFYKGYEDKTGTIWFATQGSGLVVYRDNKFYPAFAHTALPKSIRCLLLRNSGDILAGTNNNGLFLLKDSTATPLEHPALRGVLIMSLAEDVHKKVWVATNGNGIVEIDGDRVIQYKTEQGLSSNVVNTIYCTPAGDVLIGTVKGLDILSGGKITQVKITEGLQITSIEVDQFKSIWLSTERGLVRINQAHDVQEIFSVEQGLPALALTSLTFDREGSLWLTTNKAGLVRLKDSGIITYHQAHGLSLDLINVVYEDTQGKIYVGTDGGDVDIFDGDRFHNLKLHSLNKNIGVRAIYTDSKDNVWIGSYNGLLKKNGISERTFDTQNGLPSQDVRRIIEDSRANLWVATRSGGVMRLRDNKVQKVFDRNTGLKSNYILAMEQDSFGNIYLGTNGGGLSIISVDDSVKTYHIKADDSGILIFNIHVDEDGSVWLVTTTGIFLFDGKTFRALPLTQTQKGESFFDWVEDDFNNIWITSNKGVLRIKADAVADFKRGKSVNIQSRLYNNNDGMRNKECTGTMRAIKTSKGEIWIPTIGGVTVINPKNLTENPVLPPVYITKLVTDEKTFYPSETIDVKPGNLRYTFHFTSLSLVAPDKNQFRYMLEGTDNQWVSSNFERQVTYTNLSPGSYTFRVLASNNDGVWNETAASVQFKVQPFFYQTFSFYALSVFVMLVGLFAVFKWRVRDIEKRNHELQKVNSELDKFVYSASHDLRAPLASVLGVVNIARLDGAEENRENYLSLIEKSIKKLDGFISDIINFSRNARLEVTYTEIDFEKVVYDIMEDLKYLDEDSRILRKVSAVGTGRFYTDVIRLKIILNNLIANAFKYHNPQVRNPFIDVKIKYDSQQAVIKISDNGLGIAPQHIDSIFKMFYRANEHSQGSGLGLYIVKETVDKIKGNIDVRSKFNEGTEFEITIPSSKN